MNTQTTTTTSPSSPINDGVGGQAAQLLAVGGMTQMVNAVIPNAIDVGSALYELGGKAVLSEPVKTLVKEGLAEQAPALVQKLGGQVGAKVLEAAGKEAAKEATEIVLSEGAKELAKAGVRTSAMAGARVLGGAGALGAIVEGGASAIVNGRKYANGEISGAECAKRVGKDTAIGGVSAAVGTGAAIVVVAVTGPVSVPIALGVTLVASAGARFGLQRAFS